MSATKLLGRSITLLMAFCIGIQFVEDTLWAERILKFIVWSSAIMSTLVFASVASEESGLTKESKAKMWKPDTWVSHIFSAISIASMLGVVALGWTFTGIAYLWFIVSIIWTNTLCKEAMVDLNEESDERN